MVAANARALRPVGFGGSLRSDPNGYTYGHPERPYAKSRARAACGVRAGCRLHGAPSNVFEKPEPHPGLPPPSPHT